MNKVLTGVLLLSVAAVVLTAFVKYEDWVTIPRAREPVAAFMKDPASLQFRNDRITASGWLCGEVNAKNSMGGYTGFKKYMSRGPTVNYIEGDGVLGEWSGQDFIEKLDAKVAYMKRLNAAAERLGVDASFSDEDAEIGARRNFFNKKWDEICDPAPPPSSVP
jgi:hypothetical protein